MSGRLPRVAHFVVGGDVGGIGPSLAELASRPALAGAEQIIVLMTHNEKLRARFRAAGVAVRESEPIGEDPLSYLRRAYGTRALDWLCGVLREEKIDALHAHTFGSYVLGARAAQRLGLPFFRTEHGVGHYRDPSCVLHLKWALFAADRILTVSDFVRRFVVARLPALAPRTQSVPEGIDLAHYAPLPSPSSGPFTFAAVARLEPVRRLDLAIKAVARLNDVRLEVAGEGSQRQALERLITSLGLQERVRLLGFQQDVRGVVGRAHALVNCTREEACGVALMEGAAMARAAVAYEGGGIPEVIDAGETGWLYSELSVDALAAAMREASASAEQAARLGLAAREKAEARFGVARMCAGHARIYGDRLAIAARSTLHG